MSYNHPMHEMSVTENILRISLEHAERAKAKSITAITLRLGQLSSLVDDSIRFYWEIIAKDTLAEKAELRFERVAARVRCIDCGNEFDLPKDRFACTACASEKLSILSGDDLRVESIEIEN